MLYSLDSESMITSIPHKTDYDKWRSRLTDTEYQSIDDELHSRISESEIETSSWMPGRDWTGTVFHPIYEKACLRNTDAAGKFFGLILWCVVKDHEDTWAFGRYKLGNIPIQGLTYFRIQRP